jgi:hypothetical protein
MRVTRDHCHGPVEINFFRISKVLVYVFGSKRIDFRAILRNTLGTPLERGEATVVKLCSPNMIRSGFLRFFNLYEKS